MHGGAATKKALSPIRRHLRGTARSPLDEVHSTDHAGAWCQCESWKTEAYRTSALTVLLGRRGRAVYGRYILGADGTANMCLT